MAAVTPLDPPTRLVELPSGPVAIRDSGQGPALLCLHGLPGSSWDFRYIAGAAGDRLRVIRVDRPGFGDTPLATGPGELGEDFVDVCVALLDALGLERAAWMGHSIGGPACIRAAARVPERVSALALVCSPGLTEHVGFRRSRIRAVGRAMRRPWLARLLRPLLIPSFEAQGFKRVTEDQARRALYCASRLDFDGVAQDVAQVRCPSLLTWTADDPLVEPAIGEALSARLPGGPRLVWSDGGHNPQKPYATEIVDALIEMMPA